MNKSAKKRPVPQPVQSTFNRLLLAGLLVGLFSGLFAVFMFTKDVEGAFFHYLFPALALVLLVTLFITLRHHKSYWTTLFQRDKTTGVGQLMGIAVFGILLALALFAGTLYVTLYLFGGSEWENMKPLLQDSFTNLRMLLLVLVAVAVSFGFVLQILRSRKHGSSKVN